MQVACSRSTYAAPGQEAHLAQPGTQGQAQGLAGSACEVH